MIKYVKGNILNCKADIIAHQVNCQGAMNSGVAKAIRNKYPIVFLEYKKVFDIQNKYDILGSVQFVKIEDNKIVANLFAQLNYGYDNKQYTNYDALEKCLKELAEFCIKHNKSVAIPYKMSCVRGGGNWEIVYSLIEKYFTDEKIIMYIVELG